MFKTLGNAWKIAELRKKILYTLLMLLVYRVGVIIPVPGVNASYVAESVGSYTALEFLNMMSGGGLENMSIFALGISPYLNASIVMNLLNVCPKTAKKGRRRFRRSQDMWRLHLD